MTVDGALYATVLITLLIILDPPSAIPGFLGLAGRRSRADRARAAWRATLVSLGVISATAVGGWLILSRLHLEVAALQGAAGLLLLFIALDLVRGRDRTTPVDGCSANVALVALGAPSMAGPGAVAAVIVYLGRADGRLAGYLAVAAAILTVHLVLFLVLRFATAVIRLLGESGITLLARIAGLLLAAIAVQLVADSIRGFIEGT